MHNTKNKKMTFKRWTAVFAVCALTVAATSALSTKLKTPHAEAAWYSSSGTYWNYRKTITIDHTKVSNSDQSNFPVLINLTSDSDLASKALDNANDIVFTSSDETTLLPFEIEKFDGNTGQLVAWVKVSTLSHSTDTIIYLYYGNSSASDQQDAANVWDSDFATVFHLKETGTNPTVYDSTANGESSSYQTWTPASNGQIDGAAGIVKTSTNQIITTFNSDTSSNITLSAWGKSNTAGLVYAALASNNQGTGAFLKTDSSGHMRGYVTFSGGGITITDPASLDTNWHLWVITVSGTTVSLYKDGSLVSSSIGSGTRNPGNTALTIGTQYYNGNSWWNGYADEVRYSNVARSANWISTEYANQNSPSTFSSLGSESSRDLIAPTNPTLVTALYSYGGDEIVNNAGADSTPYFEWPAVGQTGGAVDTTDFGDPSGVAGYYSYFGTSCGDGGANPEITRGVLENTGDGLHYTDDTTISVPELTEEGAYCLRVKTADNAGNVSSTSELYSYTYDATPPSPPSFISASPSGYTGTNSYTFSWPAGSDGSGSGISGYQYKRGNEIDDWSEIIADQSVSGIEAYQEGTNVFLLRSVDLMGNTSNVIQTSYYYTTTAPTKPGNLAVEPTGESSANAFAFSWDAPSHTYAITDYGYSINAWPSDSDITWTGSTNTSLSSGPYATQQGTNNFYLVAKDEAGNYAYDSANVATVSFYCTSPAPPIPVMLAISDISDRSISSFSLAVKWAAGEDQDDSFDHYSIERSTNGSNYSEISTTPSTTYLDQGLSEGQVYYYRIRSVDNAGKYSAYSSILSRTPTGRFNSPPTYVENPEATSVKATEATITWVTNRASTSQVRYGTEENSLDDQKGQIDAFTSHSVTLSGLSPTTKYYLQAQSLDENRDYNEDDAYSTTIEFTTLALPTVAEATVSNITLNSADISWETSVATSSIIKYGNSLNYGQSEEVDSGSYVTKHTYKLTGLDHSTTYHIKIDGQDTDGNEFSSDDYVFETKKMPSISGIGYQQDKTGSAPAVKVTWRTNVPTSSAIEYKPADGTVTMEESASTLVADHSLMITGLADSTDYSFTLSGRDEFGNETKSDLQKLTTSADSRPPKISNVQIETSNVAAGQEDQARIVVSWDTDEDSTSKVEYAQGVSGGEYTQSTQEDSALSSSHLVIVTDLESASPYHLRVCSKDKAGNQACSDDSVAIPGEVKKSILTIILNALSNAFGWIKI